MDIMIASNYLLINLLNILINELFNKFLIICYKYDTKNLYLTNYTCKLCEEFEFQCLIC